MSKKLVAYFSASGTTAAAAKTLAETAADLKNSAPGAVIRDGKLLNGRRTRESLAAWVNSLSV